MTLDRFQAPILAEIRREVAELKRKDGTAVKGTFRPRVFVALPLSLSLSLYLSIFLSPFSKR